jgi:hypothetical protein
LIKEKNLRLFFFYSIVIQNGALVCLGLTIDYKTRRGQTCVILLDVANLWRSNILAATPTCFIILREKLALVTGVDRLW